MSGSPPLSPQPGLPKSGVTPPWSNLVPGSLLPEVTGEELLFDSLFEPALVVPESLFEPSPVVGVVGSVEVSVVGNVVPGAVLEALSLPRPPLSPQAVTRRREAQRSGAREPITARA